MGKKQKIKQKIKEKIEERIEEKKQSISPSSSSSSFQSDSEDPLRVCFKINKIFFSVLLLCLYAIARSTHVSFINTFLTMIFISTLGYFTHVLAHKFNFQEIYKNQDCYLNKNSYIDTIVLWLCKAADFHDEIHHDSSINKRWDNIIYECILNFLTQGGLFLLFIILLKKCSYSVVLLWALLYMTIHNINYNIVFPTTHRDHHYKKTTNYGIDFYDIFFNSKFDIRDIENQNHGAINLVILTAIILYFNRSNN